MMSAGKFRLSSGTFSFIGIAFHASNELTTVGLAMILTLFSSGRVCLFNSYLPFRHQTRGAGGSWGSKSASCVQIKVETLRTKGISLRCYASNSKALSTQTPARRNIIDILVDVSAIELWDILTDRNLTFFYELHLALRSEDFKAVCSDQSQSGTRKVVDIQLSYTTPLPLAGLRANNTEKIEARWRDSEFQEWVMESTASTSNVPFSSLFINRVYWQVKSSGHGKARLRIQGESFFPVRVLYLN